jgi:hypothetical protein
MPSGGWAKAHLRRAHHPSAIATKWWARFPFAHPTADNRTGASTRSREELRTGIVIDDRNRKRWAERWNNPNLCLRRHTAHEFGGGRALSIKCTFWLHMHGTLAGVNGGV